MDEDGAGATGIQKLNLSDLLTQREVEGLLGLEAGGDGDGGVGSSLLLASWRVLVVGALGGWWGRGSRLVKGALEGNRLVPRMTLSLSGG